MAGGPADEAGASAGSGLEGSGPKRPILRSHYSGLWVGEAKPGPGLEGEIPPNPIKWSLTLLPSPSSPSAFGAGFFDDAADIPGEQVLFYLLKGTFDPSTFEVKLSKTYDSPNVSRDLSVEYEGRLQEGPDGQPALTGTWVNAAGGSFGTFAARLEE